MTRNDRITQILLALIAIALFANALNPWLLGPTAEAAQSNPMQNVEALVQNIDENLEIIALGSCMNVNLC